MALRATAAPEGAGRYDRLHGDEGTIDLEPFMEQAQEEIVETIMLFGQYPQPKKRFGPTGAIRFDLYELVEEKYDNAELVELAVCMLTSWGSDLDNLHQREVAKLQALVEKAIDGHEIVRDRAEELANEALEAA